MNLGEAKWGVDLRDFGSSAARRNVCAQLGEFVHGWQRGSIAILSSPRPAPIRPNRGMYGLVRMPEESCPKCLEKEIGRGATTNTNGQEVESGRDGGTLR